MSVTRVKHGRIAERASEGAEGQLEFGRRAKHFGRSKLAGLLVTDLGYELSGAGAGASLRLSSELRRPRRPTTDDNLTILLISSAKTKTPVLPLELSLASPPAPMTRNPKSRQSNVDRHSSVRKIYSTAEQPRRTDRPHTPF